MEVTITTDKRYRIMVLLQRTDRPAYYDFHCPRCGKKVGELVNQEVKALSDVIHMDRGELVGVRCDGRIFDRGEPCRTWYYFTLGVG